MYKGYKNRFVELQQTNNRISSLPFINKCAKCARLNPILHSPAFNNVQYCLFCGNPFYIINTNK
jgi:hypothetical protein